MAAKAIRNGGSWGLQVMLAMGAFALLAFYPPSAGRMLIIPLNDDSEAGALNIALARGARLISPGPFLGSFVIEGVRARLAVPLAHARTILVAAPPAGCGQELAS